MDQVSLIPILLFVAALASAGIVLWRGPRPIDRSFEARTASRKSISAVERARCRR